MGLFKHLIRFKTSSGNVFYGDVQLLDDTSSSYVGQTVSIFEGEKPWHPDFKLSHRTETIAEVLCPLESVPIFVCVGLNYRQHAAEAGVSKIEQEANDIGLTMIRQMPITPYPVIFNKPPDAAAGPYEDIPVHVECKCMDYEAELCFVIGKDCKNVSEHEDALQYVLGYTAGNDVSSRYWQQPERSGSQHGSAKSFDKFAPIGPVLTSRDVIQDPHHLAIKSFVNGELRQSSRTDDLIYDIPTIIRHISRGITLRKGTVVMTGTPSGVAAFMKPPKWLEDGDVVEVEIDNIGRLRNKMIIEK